ncbi:MAG: VWA domain-containing protein [Myxococcales bacterium]|nr:VWA domain-containing protein [Myxococcales bacterium]
MNGRREQDSGRRWAGLAFAAIVVALLFGARDARAEQIKLNALLSHPSIQANKSGTIYLKVGLTGFEMSNPKERAPVNLSVVLDRSGSMAGDKLYHAREAAKMVVDMLNANDVFSLVVYDHTVRVLIPSTRVNDKEGIKAQIDRIRPGGSTALFAGVSKGIAEVRKFLAHNRVNRVILLSDGLANVGPSSPNALGRLGAAARKLGVAVTTVGLGLDYNEDLMTQLAQNSDGNHGFARTATDLTRIFKAELGDVLTVVAQEVSLTITCAPGIRPVRVIDRQATIRGQKVSLTLNQLYSKQEKFVLLEVEVPAGKDGSQLKVADVAVQYANMRTKTADKLTSTVSAGFSADAKQVDSMINRQVMVDVVDAIANEMSKKALILRDQGNIDKARVLLLKNERYLNTMGNRYNSRRLLESGVKQRKFADRIRGKRWKKTRKAMRKMHYLKQNQMSY